MKLSQCIAASALAAAWLVATPAQAGYITRQNSTPGARLCTLSIPTTDTKVRPKATGFRNEGTANAFVICAFDTPPGEQALAPVEIPSDPFGIQLFLGTIDGKSHGIDCTGVNSWPDASSVWGGPMQYVVKHVDVSSVAPVRAMWSPEDFGGTSKIPTSGSFSVTCLLPPGAVIYLGSMISNEEVGN
jgi:hypothetical protein